MGMDAVGKDTLFILYSSSIAKVTSRGGIAKPGSCMSCPRGVR